MTVVPDTLRKPVDGTEALQDGWVSANKAPRKSPLPAPSLTEESEKKIEPWEKVQDGWDKHK